MVELVRQPLAMAQEVDGLADAPVLRGAHHLDLHQAAGGVIGIGQRLFDGGAFMRGQRAQQRLLPVLIEILDEVDL